MPQTICQDYFRKVGLSDGNHRLERLMARLRRGVFSRLKLGHLVIWLAAESDKRLFRAVITDPCHVLSRPLPEVESTSYNLRPRAHCFDLPTKDTRNFIPRMLYEKIYCK